jgi:hypothetical protein
MGLLDRITKALTKGNDSWEEVAKELNAEFITGGFFKTEKITLQNGIWVIILDTIQEGTEKNKQTFTRMQASFIRKEEIKMKVYRENIFTSLGKLFGFQDIVLGHEEFDNKFIIKGNNENCILDLLDSNEIIELMLQNKSPYWAIKMDDGMLGQSYPENVSVLYFKHHGKLIDKTQLINLFALFNRILKRLVKLGMAKEDQTTFTPK